LLSSRHVSRRGDQLRATDYFPFVAYFAHRAVQRVGQSDRGGGRPARENED
jgi:hypothetical protein